MTVDPASIPAPWRPLGVSDSWGRPMYLARVPTIDAAMDLPLPELASGTPRGWFKLFLASEVPQHKDDRAYDVALRFTLAGCCYMCAWGASCSEWHDTFDDSVVMPQVDGTPSLPFPDDEAHHLMTSWFERDSLDESRWFFAANADPTEGFRHNCTVCLVLVIGGTDFATTVEASCLRGVENPDDSP
ncbi:MAG: hypothetical protein K2Y21_16030 [Phycisphaerales bacterium]|nr:hypothetical protein [Phycisphaerales bacterium]